MKLALDAVALVIHPYAVMSAYVAEKRRRPVAVAPFFPWMPASRFAEPIFAPRTPRIGPIRRWLTELALRSVWDLAMDFHQRTRETLGLARFRSKNPWNELLGPRFPCVNLWSETLAPRPADWPEWCHVAGFVLEDAPDGYEPPAALAEFLRAPSGRLHP